MFDRCLGLWLSLIKPLKGVLGHAPNLFLLLFFVALSSVCRQRAGQRKEDELCSLGPLNVMVSTVLYLLFDRSTSFVSAGGLMKPLLFLGISNLKADTQ
jgi:hypothetical protein